MITIHTDGGCHSSTGTGGWAAVIAAKDMRRVSISGAERNTTNNRMELLGAINALEFVISHELYSQDIKLISDSQYVINGITSWVHGWKAKGWVTSQKEPVINRDLWERLDELNSKLNVSWNWVKGHAGDEYNEMCDRLTQEAIATIDEPDKQPAEPSIVNILKASLSKDMFGAKSVTVRKDPITVTIKKPSISLDSIRSIIKEILDKENYTESITFIVEDIV